MEKSTSPKHCRTDLRIKVNSFMILLSLILSIMLLQCQYRAIPLDWLARKTFGMFGTNVSSHLIIDILSVNNEIGSRNTTSWSGGGFMSSGGFDWIIKVDETE